MLRSTAAAVAALALAACSPSEDPGITVSGTVVSLQGGPIAGATVHVADRAPATTAVDGTFQVSGVKPPYDLVAVANDEGRIFVTVHEGLGIADPIVAVEAPAPRSAATVSGTIAGWSPEPGDVTLGTVCSLHPYAHAFEFGPDGTWSASVSWDGGLWGGTTILALQYAPGPDGLPATYRGKWGYGTVDLLNGAAASGVVLAANPPEDVTVSASWLSLPSGYEVVRADVVTGTGRCAFALPPVPSPASPFTYVAPFTGSGDLFIGIVAEDGAGARVTGWMDYALQLGDRDRGVYLPAGVTLLSPAHGASLAPGTEFSWAGGASGVQVLRLAAAPGDPIVRIVTAATRATLAGLARAGVALPSGAPYRWTVEALPLGPDDYARSRGIGTLDDAPPVFRYGTTSRSATRPLVVP